jgi:hypothetical protein
MRRHLIIFHFIFQAIISMGDLPILEKKIDFNKRMKRDPAEDSKNKQKMEESPNERNNNRKDKRKSSDHKKTF